MNIVLVVFDTWRKDCAGVYDPTPWGKVHTPNFERFARESLVMSRAYPESLPTLEARRAMYTGRRVYPFHNADFNKYWNPGWGPIPSEQQTVAEILSYAGYRTALIGDATPMFLPTMNYIRGYQQWTYLRGQVGEPARSGPRPTQAELDHWVPEEIRNGKRGRGQAAGFARSLVNMRDRTHEEDYFPPRVFREAARWLEQNRDADRFFLTIEEFDPHEPWLVPEHYRKMYMAEDGRENVISFYRDVSDVDPKLLERTRANYFGDVTLCDRWFGYFIDTLRVMGLLDDTMVVLTSDHGHAIGDRVLMAEGDRVFVTDFVGKWGYPSGPPVYDIPLMIRLPGGAHGGTRSDHFVQHHDIAAVILKAAGVELPAEIEGIPFVDDAVSGGPGRRDHVTVAWGSAVTVINDRWWFNCRADGSGFVLHDLKTPAPFTANVAEDNPETVKALFAMAEADATDGFPEYILELARTQPDIPRDAYIYS